MVQPQSAPENQAKVQEASGVLKDLFENISLLKTQTQAQADETAYFNNSKGENNKSVRLPKISDRNSDKGEYDSEFEEQLDY